MKRVVAVMGISVCAFFFFFDCAPTPPQCEKTICSGQCTDTNNNETHCGSCDNACKAGETCKAGKCELICPDQQNACGDECVDTSKDRAHCGKCDNACKPGETCNKGTCELDCPADQTVCSASCVNTQNDAEHCGACGNGCKPGEVCSSGQCVASCPPHQTTCNSSCVDIKNDTEHCGACGNKCNQDQSCISGSCQLTCQAGQTKCNGACVDTQTNASHCGGCDNVCPTGQGCKGAACAGAEPPITTETVADASSEKTPDITEPPPETSTDAIKETSPETPPESLPAWSIWANRAGGSDMERSASIAVDNQGNTYVTGIFSGTADFGATTLNAGNSSTGFVAKLDTSGKWLWAKQITTTSSVSLSSLNIAIDPQGNLFAAGFFAGSITLGSTSLTSQGKFDILVAKLDASGKWLWAKSAGSLENEQVTGLTADSQGVYLTGTISGNTTLGSTTLTTKGSSDIFVARLDATGKWLWAKRAGSTGADIVSGVAVDSKGSVYLTGAFAGAADFGNTSLNVKGQLDIFVAKLDGQGKWLWAKRAGGLPGKVDLEMGRSVGVDSKDNVYVSGAFSSAADFGSTSLTPRGTWDGFVAKLDASGTWLWAKQIHSNSTGTVTGLILDSQDNLYVTGDFAYNVDFGGKKLGTQGGAFVAKMDNKGAWVWARQAGSAPWSGGAAIALDPQSNVLVTGDFSYTTDFGGTSLKSKGSNDIFVWKLKP